MSANADPRLEEIADALGVAADEVSLATRALDELAAATSDAHRRLWRMHVLHVLEQADIVRARVGDFIMRAMHALCVEPE